MGITHVDGGANLYYNIMLVYTDYARKQIHIIDRIRRLETVYGNTI